MTKSFAFLLATSAVASAATISGTNVVLSTNAGFSDYTLTVYQNAGATDPTSIFFDRQGQNLIFRTYNVDESSDWYFADYNNSFTAASISQSAFMAFNQVDQSYNVGFGDFYLGVNTGNGFQGGSPGREVFGWALLRNSANGLQLLENAVTYDSPGIRVGTTTTVPEPTTLFLLSLASVGSLSVRRRSLLANSK